MRFLVGAAALMFSACGGQVCGGNEGTSSDTAPVLTDVNLVGNLPGDPWNLVFGITFTDAPGDLGTGRGEFFLNSSERAEVVQLQSQFEKSSVPLDARSGQIAVTLRFPESIDDDDTVDFSSQVIDQAGERSNCFALELHFDVTELGLAQKAKTWLAGIWHRVVDDARDG